MVCDNIGDGGDGDKTKVPESQLSLCTVIVMMMMIDCNYCEREMSEKDGQKREAFLSATRTSACRHSP